MTAALRISVPHRRESGCQSRGVLPVRSVTSPMGVFVGIRGTAKPHDIFIIVPKEPQVRGSGGGCNALPPGVYPPAFQRCNWSPRLFLVYTTQRLMGCYQTTETILLETQSAFDAPCIEN